MRFSRSPGMLPSRSPSEGAAWDHELVARLEHDLAEANAAAEAMSVELRACSFKLTQSREEVEMLTCQVTKWCCMVVHDGGAWWYMVVLTKWCYMVLHGGGA